MGGRIIAALFAVLTLVGVAVPASAVTNGTYDGTQHPYVGYVNNDAGISCSGTLLSPTVLLTAAHCFSSSTSGVGTNLVTGAPLVRVSFDPDLENTPVDQRTWYVGSYYFDPQFQGGNGTANFATHDVALVIFGEPGCAPPTDLGTYLCGAVPSSATSGEYGELPTPGLVDSLPMGTPVDIVGYGVQYLLNGSGPCDPNCARAPGPSQTRLVATTTLIASDDATSEEFIKLHSNAGGVCFGDSGGPNLLGGSDIVLAVTSFGANSVCTGNSHSYRVDTAEALAWIATTAAAHGASV